MSKRKLERRPGAKPRARRTPKVSDSVCHEQNETTLTCKTEVAFIARYLAAELQGGERAAFEDHLEGCPDCAAFLHTYKKTIELTKNFLARPTTPIEPLEFSSTRNRRRAERR